MTAGDHNTPEPSPGGQTPTGHDPVGDDPAGRDADDPGAVRPSAGTPQPDADTRTRLEVSVNGRPEALAPGATVADLVSSLGLRPELVAVEVNRTLVPRRLHQEHALAHGDRIEVVTLVGGG
jgi:sulfur carrier protein